MSGPPTGPPICGCLAMPLLVLELHCSAGNYPASRSKVSWLQDICVAADCPAIIAHQNKAKMDDVKDVDFMDFSENATDFAKSVAFCRPHLSTDRRMVYEDSNRSGQVLSEMHRFYQDERLCDVVLKVDDNKFPCHRLVLAASSLYFERMFSNDMTEARATEIRLKNLSPCALKHLIEFAYTSKLCVQKDTVLEIFEAADMLNFPAARLFCQDFLMDQINLNNCLSFITYADAFSCEPLYEKAKSCAAANFQEIKNTPEFLEMPKGHLTELLMDDNIEMEYEEHIFEALKKWVLHDRGQRFAVFPELFRCIRLNFVSRWYLIEVISKDKLVTESPECNNIIQSAKDQLLAQGHTYEIPWQLPPSRKCTGLTWKIVYINTYDPNPSESEVFLFDVVNKSWSNTSKPCPLASEFSTCESLGDALLIIGGWSVTQAKSLNQRGAVNTIHEFKVMSIFPTLWYVGAYPMGISRYLHSTIRVGANIYLIGGLDEAQFLQASVFVTSAERGYRFQPCPRMPYPVYKPAVAHWENHLYVFGGFGLGGVPRQFIQCFNIAKQKWTEVYPSLEGGSHVACIYAVTINDLIYVVCGELDSHRGSEHPMVGHRVAAKCVDFIFTFNPLNNQRQVVFRFPEKRTGSFCITALNNKIYFTGGTKEGLPHYAVDCYDPAGNTFDSIGSTREGGGALSLCSTMRVMHENFGL